MEIKEKKINNIIFNIAYIYISIPIVIFCITWLKWYYSFVLIVFLLFGLYRLCSNIHKAYKGAYSKKDIKVFVIAFVIIIAWVYLSGIGGFVYQNTDHTCRNQIYEILVNYKWPVIKQLDVDGVTTNMGLIYYIAFWIPAAAFGKLFGVTAGYVFQAIWATIGICLFFYMICIYFKRVSIFPLIAFILFSGLDLIGLKILNPDSQFVNRSLHIEWWASDFQFSSFTTQLFWVFNQALPLWLFVMLILLQENNKQMVFLMGLAVLYGPFPFLGLVPFCMVEMLARKYDGANTFKMWLFNFFKDTFTIENVLCGGFIGIVSFLYLKGNYVAQITESSAKNKDIRGFFFMFLIFFVLEAGVYFIAIAKNSVNNRLFYVSLISLIIIPFIKVGYNADFCMRVSIPALLVLFLLTVDSIYAYKKSGDKIRLYILIALLVIGAATPLREINRTLVETRNRYINEENIAFDKVSEEEIFISPNFSGETDGNFFYEKLAR